MNIEYFNSQKVLQPDAIVSIADFLHKELEQYGDPSNAIEKAIRYAMDDSTHKGGLVAVMYDEGQIIGAVVINRTGMEEYIPENILVYIAVSRNYRGKGLGKKLLSAVFGQIDGDVALHVEPSNPAIRLYYKMGFENKYLEMRLLRKEG